VTRDIAVLLGLFLVGAGWLIVHVLLLLRVARAATLPSRVRVLAFLPPVTPWLGWIAGARALTWLWALHCVAYCVLTWLSTTGS
jgi:hypothetical protein